jgi:hypothetical protein
LSLKLIDIRLPRTLAALAIVSSEIAVFASQKKEIDRPHHGPRRQVTFALKLPRAVSLIFAAYQGLL